MIWGGGCNFVYFLLHISVSVYGYPLALSQVAVLIVLRQSLPQFKHLNNQNDPRSK
jgi:hypothetical protein